ncbi:aldo/keto reductase [Bdellovibrio sp. SKB1291214]|uniref:aldo/keto reductase n=1 Tax=Bdellovibrio sp. SKB1291214 TaxID=1732569 RepID=UPI000B5182C7|nr:aldo/keto reductase [Bdellovibrio sp. SKB1291214]UYL08581.1 aldo/keto reductase [Bdellovibrio sp. SKB1291214]
MQKRQLGKTGIEVAPLCFGGNVFGWTIDEKASFKVLDSFVESGFNFIDTADVYSRWVPGNKGGESETIIGNWMKERKCRDKVVIATKVGMELAPDKKGLKGAYIKQAVEDSLMRLKTDYIDLYQSHTDDIETPLEETLAAYNQLVKEGKVRAVGASNFNAERLKQSLHISENENYPSYVTLQPKYNLHDREYFEKDLEPLCLNKQVGVIPYYSLASGFLTGKYRSKEDVKKSARGEKALSYLDERGMKILATLDDLSNDYQVKPATIALAWLMQRKSITAPIASATSIEQLKDLTKAVDIHLTTVEVEKLDFESRY